ncbi:Sec-independent protein translocase protein TatB [Lebetimonas sp. JH292]|uniref:Sec-independent protein translocase protein TatB n=1 Tax=Lebetimonas sp. JH292 TaxID=990068 RepID=UPI001F005DEF|nr:Sec-independent protein translocase protein TatB [Lebetimonas sp. JH292]
MGFSEILFVAVIAIIVLGPEKLPDAMRDLGRLFIKIKKMWRDATADIRRELELEEMKTEMEEYKKQLQELQNKVSGEVNDIKSSLTSLDELTATGNTRDFSDMISSNEKKMDNEKCKMENEGKNNEKLEKNEKKKNNYPFSIINFTLG